MVKILDKIFRCLVRSAALIILTCNLVVVTNPWKWGTSGITLGVQESCPSSQSLDVAFGLSIALALGASIAMFLLGGKLPNAATILLSLLLAANSARGGAWAIRALYCGASPNDDKFWSAFAPIVGTMQYMLVDLITYLRASTLCEALHFHKTLHALRWITVTLQVFYALNIWKETDLRWFQFIFAPGHMLTKTIWVVCLIIHMIYLCGILFIFSVPLRALYMIRKSPSASEWPEVSMLIHMAAQQIGAVVVNLSSGVYSLIVTSSLIIDHGLYTFDMPSFIISLSADGFCQVCATVVLSGVLHTETRGEQFKREASITRSEKHNQLRAAYKPCLDTSWQEAVESLANRGFSLRNLLLFYERLFEVMPHFDPNRHTTGDVVRGAIIPDSAGLRCAYATKMNDGARTRPNTMVTHTWSNFFRDLVAGIISDALGEPTYHLARELLDTNMPMLWKILSPEDLSRTYWVCAFCVNQHASICGANPHHDKDPVTGTEFEPCHCALAKYFNDTPPLSTVDGRGIRCEMNKFDDMMAWLAATDKDFRHITVVDAAFRLFTRAWCIAELVESDKMCLPQKMVMKSHSALEQATPRLKDLNIENMTAARVEDVAEILAKIDDVNVFNRHLHKLLFDEDGLLSLWAVDTFGQLRSIGRLTRIWRATCSVPSFHRSGTPKSAFDSHYVESQSPTGPAAPRPSAGEALPEGYRRRTSIT